MGGVVKSVGGFLFGDGGDEPEVVESEKYLPSQQQLIGKLAEFLYNQMGGKEGEPVGVEPYPGQIYAGASPLQQTLFSYLANAPAYANALNEPGYSYLTGDPFEYQARAAGLHDVAAQRALTDPYQYQARAAGLHDVASQWALQDPYGYQARAAGLQDVASQWALQDPLRFKEYTQSLRDVGTRFLTDQSQYEYGPERQYWEEAFAKPTREAFFEETVPQLQEMFAGQGALDSSGFNRALAREAQRMETSLGGQLADVLYRGRESFLDRQLQERGLGLSTLDRALAQAGMLQAQQRLGLGAYDLGTQEMAALREQQRQGLETYGLGMQEMAALREQQRQGLETYGLGMQEMQMLQNQQLQAIPLYSLGQNEMRMLQAQQGVGLSTLDRALAQLGMLPGAGQMQQQTMQAPLTEAYQKWAYQQPYNNPWLPLIAPTLGAIPYQTNVMPGTPGSPGLVGALAPGIGMGLGGVLGDWLS